MKYLYKVLTITVEGHEGMESESQSFITSGVEKIENEKPVTQEEVMEADVPFLSYIKYENLGIISDEELKILRKFKIVG